MSGGGQRDMETQNPKQAPGSELSAQSPTWGSKLVNGEIMTWAEVGCSTDWDPQAAQTRSVLERDQSENITVKSGFFFCSKCKVHVSSSFYKSQPSAELTTSFFLKYFSPLLSPRLFSFPSWVMASLPCWIFFYELQTCAGEPQGWGFPPSLISHLSWWSHLVPRLPICTPALTSHLRPRLVHLTASSPATWSL